MKIGFIGVGNMGGAILKGYVKAKGNRDVYAFDADNSKLNVCKEQFDVTACEGIQHLTEICDLIIIAVKPNVYDVVLPEIKKSINTNKIILSVAAGITMDYIEKSLGDGTKVIRIMPNTPALVNEGMTAVFKNQYVSEKETVDIISIIETVGKAKILNEDMIHTVIGVSGSCPAYVYMFIDALIDGAVKNGMDREQAKIFAAQSVLGAAKMVIETGEEPEKLRIDVCSPGGTTIEAVETLFENGFQKNVVQGMEAAIEKSKKMAR